MKVTIFLASYNLRDAYAAVRWKIMGGPMVALSTVIAGPYDPNWMIEIEAITVGR